MGRAPRIFELGEIYHLTAHGVDDRKIFLDDDDRQSFVMRLRRVVRAYAWELWAYCLMDTHYHLLVSHGQSPTGCAS
jgi:REP element-mobilizing transposase RayT